MNDPLPLGKIRRAPIYNVTCAVCGKGENTVDAGPVMGYSEAIATFRAFGWRRRIDNLYVCQDCR